MNSPNTKYYNKIATQYDQSRFDNTYGQYIDQQERNLLKELTKGVDKANILDLGCGTGRFLDFAHYGVDPSPEMLAIAKEKYPDKELFTESGHKTQFKKEQFDIVFSFHVFMHLELHTIKEILNEAHRMLKPGGRLIVDIPSKKRRNLLNFKSENWHGATAFNKDDIIKITREKWNLINHQGLLFFPIHRFPKSWRKTLIKTDSLLCQSFLKEYSSYLVFIIEKK